MSGETYKIADADGSEISLEASVVEGDGRVYLRAATEGVYVLPGDLRELADAAEEITGTVRAERFLPTVDDLQEGKEGDVVAEIRKASREHDPAIVLPLIEAAKDLVRKALPESASGVVVLDLGS